MELANLARDQRLLLMQFICSFAWADARIQPEERAFVSRMIHSLGLSQDEMAQVEAWLEVPPDPVAASDVPREHRVMFVESISALVLSDGKIAPEELALFQPLIA